MLPLCCYKGIPTQTLRQSYNFLDRNFQRIKINNLPKKEFLIKAETVCEKDGSNLIR